MPPQAAMPPMEITGTNTLLLVSAISGVVAFARCEKLTSLKNTVMPCPDALLHCRKQSCNFNAKSLSALECDMKTSNSVGNICGGHQG